MLNSCDLVTHAVLTFGTMVMIHIEDPFHVTTFLKRRVYLRKALLPIHPLLLEP